MVKQQNPIDLLPIQNPAIESPNELYFYNNVIKPLLPAIIRMEAEGIPIDLNKVAVLENTIKNVLEEVKAKLTSNKLMLAYLATETEKTKNKQITKLQAKEKSIDDFIKPFNIQNIVHRTYAVNTYLKQTNKQQDILTKWTIKDLKIYDQSTGNLFVTNILDNNIQQWMQPYIDKAMRQLAEERCIIYNKNKISTKIDTIKEQNLINLFNPGSSLQKAKFFQHYGVYSEIKTPTGEDSWKFDELKKLHNLISILLDEKGDSNESES